MIHRLIDEQSMTELFTFDGENNSEDKFQQAQFDALLRMSAITLSQLPALFESESEHSAQNIRRMQRLLLWHFYAVSFKLEQAIALETHLCAR